MPMMARVGTSVGRTRWGRDVSGSWNRERGIVLEASRKMLASGLVTGASGNVSLRIPGDESESLMAITAHGRRYEELVLDDIVITNLQAEPIDTDLMPSIEAMMHATVYRTRPDVRAMIHMHSVFASVLSVLGLEIPPIFDEQTVYIGGAIRLARYAFPGSQELADNVCEALGDRNAALLSNHGAVGVGRDMPEALSICELLEKTARVYVYARGLGNVNSLPQEAVELEQRIFAMSRTRR